MASSEQRERLREPGMEAFNAGDVDGMLAALASDVEVYASPEMAERRHATRGHDGFVAWITGWTDAWEEVTAEVTDTIPVGERHVVTVDPSGGPGPRGIEVSMELAFLFDVGRRRALHLPRDAPDAARRRFEWPSERERSLGADAPQRQAQPGLDLGQRVLAVGDQQDHLVGWEVARARPRAPGPGRDPRPIR